MDCSVQALRQADALVEDPLVLQISSLDSRAIDVSSDILHDFQLTATERRFSPSDVELSVLQNADLCVELGGHGWGLSTR
jgi:hypothetical protein